MAQTLWLALLVLKTCDQELVQGIRTITESDPRNPYDPLLIWPVLKVKAYRDKLQCVPDHYDPVRNPEIQKVKFKRNGQPEYYANGAHDSQPYGPGEAQMSSTDPFYRLASNRSNKPLAGTWTCAWQTTIIFENQLLRFLNRPNWRTIMSRWSPESASFRIIDDDEKPLTCGISWQDFPSNIPMHYTPLTSYVSSSGRRKRRANKTEKRFSKKNFKSDEISNRNFFSNAYTNKKSIKLTSHLPKFGKMTIGAPVDVKAMPWAVSIKYYKYGRASVCSGAFLSSVWVISAAHCFPDRPNPVPEGVCHIYAGINTGQTGTGRPCRRIFKHPSAPVRDVALVQLYDSNDPNRTVGDNDRFIFKGIKNRNVPNAIYGSNICLPDVRKLSDFDNKECYIAGFGPGGHQPLRAIKVKVEPLTTMYSTLVRFWPEILSVNGGDPYYFFNSEVVFAGKMLDGGDSGGPIVCKLPGSQRWQLAGIVQSHRPVCHHDPNRYDRLHRCRNLWVTEGQRISTVKDWILAYLNTTARSVDQLGTPPVLHSCGPQDYRCNAVSCVPSDWFTASMMARARRTNVTVYNWLNECKTRLNITARRASTVVNPGNGASMDSPWTFNCLRLVCVGLLLNKARLFF